MQLLKTHDRQEQGARVTAGDGRPNRLTGRDAIRRWFLAGLITIVPAAITIYAVKILVEFLRATFGPAVRPSLAKWVDVLGMPAWWTEPITTIFAIATAFLMIIAIGWLSRFLFFRRLVRVGEDWVTRIPLLRFFYVTPKEVIGVLTSKRDSVKRPVMLEYPRRGIFAIGYATGEVISSPNGQALVNVFLPTTPNPTSGFLLLVPIEDIWDINLSAEDAVRMIISGGILSPDAIVRAPFAGLDKPVNLPPSGPLTSEIPSELQRFAPSTSREDGDDWSSI